MKERPILFSPPMVRAILAGRKTMTRRVVKLPEIISEPGDADATSVGWLDHHESGPGWHGWMTEYPEEGSLRLRCPFGQPGERLWVRESFSGPRCMDAQGGCAAAPPSKWGDGSRIWYWADGNPDAGDWTKPRPGIHMPRWASRITLEVTGVRVERLQEISYDDCIAEGIKQRWTCINPGAGSYAHDNEVDADYRRLWNEINGAGSWEANPWVWVLSFKRVTP